MLIGTIIMDTPQRSERVHNKIFFFSFTNAYSRYSVDIPNMTVILYLISKVPAKLSPTTQQVQYVALFIFPSSVYRNEQILYKLAAMNN